MQKLDTEPAESTCPMCGEENNIDYQANPVDETGITYNCECGICGTRWDECYDLVFAGNWNIVDKDGKEYESLPIKMAKNES